MIIQIRRLFLSFCIALLCLFSYAASQPAAPNSVNGDTSSARILKILDSLNVAKPDGHALVELLRLKPALNDKNLSAEMDRFVAAEFIVARRPDVYKTKIKPIMTDSAAFEVSVQIQCQKCKGSGKGDLKCSSCAGNGLCPTCKGSGKRLLSNDITSLKGPSKAHDKSREVATEATCTTCKGTGDCRNCGGSGVRKRACNVCGGDGKAWDYTSALVVANTAHEKLRAVVGAINFEQNIPNSVVSVKTDNGVVRGPVFMFDGRRVVAVSARSLIDAGAISIYSHNKESVPFFNILSSKNRDLALIDIGQTSIVEALPLENDTSALEADRPVYAYGVSRDNDMSLRLAGKVTAVGSVYITTSVESGKMIDCAPLISDNGRLAGLFVFPVAERNPFGSVVLREDNGCALRLDNVLPSDFISIDPGVLRERNNTIAFAKRAIKAASEFVSTDPAELKLKRADISETIKRLDRAAAMIKGIPVWDMYLMDSIAAELKTDVETRAGNLEALLVKLDDYEAKEKIEAERKEAEAKSATNVIETVSVTDQVKSRAKDIEKEKPEGDMSDKVDDIVSRINWRKILIIAVVVIVVITVAFILMGIIQDNMRRKKLSQPAQIPDFIREMQEYERKHKKGK